MKLRVFLGVITLSTLGLVACEEGGETPTDTPPPPAAPTTPTPPPAEAPKPEPTPVDACNQLLTAVKDNNAEGLAAVTAPAALETLNAEGNKEHVVASLTGGACGEAKAEADKATVPVTVGADKEAKTVEVPFVKVPEGWRFDAAAFLEKNPAGKGKKAKKAKKAKTKK